MPSGRWILNAQLGSVVMACSLCLPVSMAPLPAHGQPADGRAPTWSQIDQGEDMKALRESLRLGEPLTDTDIVFLTQVLLPQLEAPANRAQIDRIVRRKLRDLQNVTDNPATFEQFTKVVGDFMVKLARDAKKPSIVRVNAVLLVGDLNDESRKRPWPGSLDMLIAIVADPAVSPDVRIAAAAGLQRHADTARQGGAEGQAAFAAKAAPAIAALLNPPAGMDRVAADWLTMRGLTMLRALDAAAPAAAVAAAAGILTDDGRPVDLRIRAAAAVGSSKVKDVDAAKVVATVEGIATALLRAEQAAIEEQQPAAAKSGEEPAQPARRHAAKRLAWGLATLADAVFVPDTAAGVAGLLPDPAAAKDLARHLRQSAGEIDKQPGPEAVATALAGLVRNLSQPPPPPPPPPDTTPPPSDPDEPFK